MPALLRTLVILTALAAVAIPARGQSPAPPESEPETTPAPTESESETTPAPPESESDATPAPTESEAEATPPPTVTKAEIEAALAGLETQSDLDEATRTAATDLYKEALSQLQGLQDAVTRTAELSSAATGAPDRLQEIRTELNAPAAAPEAPASDATLPALESALAEASSALAAARKEVEELQAETERRAERRTAIPDELAAVRARLTDHEESLRTDGDAGEDAAVADARRVLRIARHQVAAQEVARLTAESASYDARRELLPARRDRALRRVTAAEQRVTVTQEALTSRRRADAEASNREAQRLRREAARKHPALRDFAESLEVLAAQRTGPTGLSAAIADTERQITEARAELAKLRQQYLSVRRRIDVSGFNRATGLLLSRQYEDLSDVRRLRRRLDTAQSDLEKVEYRLIIHQDDRLGAGDIDRVVRVLLASIATQDAAPASPELASVAEELARSRRDLLDGLVADSTRHLDKLAELTRVMGDLVGATRAYQRFIERRILWVKSVAGDSVPNAEDLQGGLAWLFDREAWRDVGDSVRADIRDSWLLHLVPPLLLAVVLGASGWVRRRLETIAELVGSYRTDSIALTFRALALTFLLALPLPLLLWWLGTVLHRPPDQPSVAVGVATGLLRAASFFLPFELVRQMLRPHGLAEAHLRWPAEANVVVQRNIRWLVPVLLPLAVVVVALDRYGMESVYTTLSRIVFTLAMIALAIFMYRIARPSGPVLRRYMRREHGWISRFRHVWFMVLVGIPLLIVALTWAGYYFTARRLYVKIDDTVGLAVLLIVLSAMLARWLFVARRKVAMQDAQRRREQAQAEAAHSPDADQPTEATAPVEEERLDLPAISAQTRQLFRATVTLIALIGLSVIWADTLPALNMLERVQVWPAVAIVEGADPKVIPALEGAGPPATPTPDTPPASTAAPASRSIVPAIGGDAPAPDDAGPLSITLADVGLAALVLLATWIAFRNVPGLIEIVVLQRLPLDAGSRYAMSTVLRYLIAIVGAVIAFNAVGIGWSKVQWLAAALTFGLAFGLQEIVGNFVSGLIILGERPFRVGDTVTVGSVSGTVTRIRMRATTVVDWDRKEWMIPNKTFVLGDVTNWTLSDSVLRVIVPVGVSYGSDVRKVETLLLEIARGVSVVLDDPGPQALFLGFGDSALNFELRVYIPHIDHLLGVRHDLHMAITERFREAEIEIAFPQRDLNVRSLGDLAPLLQRHEPRSEPELPVS